jgi:hypothetical protein
MLIRSGEAWEGWGEAGEDSGGLARKMLERC